VIVRLAVRSLVTRPLRSAVLSIGFGLSIAVMAELLGVGEVILDQAHSPALSGGGDLVVTGAVGPLDSGRYLLTNVLESPALAPRVAAASPSRRGAVYLLSGNASGPIAVRAGIPSRERGSATRRPPVNRSGSTQHRISNGSDRHMATFCA